MNPQIRLRTPEQLDNLSLNGNTLKKTLNSLKLINIFLGNHRQLSKAVLSYCKSNHDRREFRIVDLGCGGGDTLRYISKRLKYHNIKATFIGIDGNPSSIIYAKERTIDTRNINFITANIIDKDFKTPDCDILISSHFIYHFEDSELTDFLKKIHSQKIEYVIFSELYRNKTAYNLFKLVSFVLPISDIAKKDGMLAIQRAFSIKELTNIIQNSTIEKYKISKKPFFRTITEIDPSA
ncbi:methyltransferase domain-containing protein [Aquimarina mytili]|uniref:Methyltransferase domain-containing protein n=1 Tax=Aquimarina mytili TaxID=874423 RepID=A0A936ZPX9_9FLAO|nr:methyltransferase domain-containing protein [Aquimarina mytili]MBL0683564.1 methyltransferase domain-containing protein [Aquimarina mytili]